MLLALLGLVSACGYHLRGNAIWPQELDVVFIQGPERHPAVLELRRALSRQDVVLSQQAGDAKAIVNVINEQISRRVASLSSQGVAREHELHYALQFSVDDGHGKFLLPQQVIELRHIYGVDADQVVAKSSEEDQLHLSLRKRAIQQLIQRLSAFAAESQ